MAQIAAYAKINLGLRVLSKRPDGYHEIETLFQSISLADELSIELTPHGVRVEMTPDGAVKEDENLVYQAIQTLFAQIGYRGGVHIRIKKVIPLASGLGGASSDAAATFVALNTLLDLKLDHDTLHSLALGLGSDVPFLLIGGLCRGRGRGELLERLPPAWTGRPIVLFKPVVSLSTALVYQTFDRLLEEKGIAPAHSADLDRDALFDRNNDLSEAAAQLCPEIRKYQSFLKAERVDLAGLSGSGPTSYAIFSERAAAESFARMATSQLGAWVRIVEATDFAQRWIIAP